jgi:branched-chain amino acid transport system permease protein
VSLVRRLAPAWLLLAALAFPLLHDNDGDIDSMANAAAYAALALGLNIVVGFAGLLDLGYAAFFAIGAYAYGILASYQIEPHWSAFWEPFSGLGLVAKVVGADGGAAAHFTVSFWLMLPVSALLAAGFGVLFGAPTLRLRGDYLALVTLGFGEIVPIVVRNWDSLTGGAQGLNGIASPRLFGHRFGVDATPYYYVAVALVAGLMVVSVRLRDSRVGRAWMAIREDEIAAAACGIDTVRAKLLAFAIGAAFAGATGTFYVAKLQTATPEMFGFPVSVMVLVMVVLGGMGSVWGVVLGAVLLQLLQSWFLPALSDWLHAAGAAVGNAWLQGLDLVAAKELVFGSILVLMMLYRRDGLIPATRRPAALSQDAQHAEVRRGIEARPLPWIGADPAAGWLLDIAGLQVRFGGLVALQGVDLAVPRGGVVAVIGPNGSGKSTLFNAITGVGPTHGGRVRLEGAEITGLPPHAVLRRGMARTFQNIRLFPHLTVLQNVLVGEHAHLTTGPWGAVFRPPRSRVEERRAREAAAEIVGMFGNRLLPRLDQPVSGLSYANRRRVEIARALAARPKLLLLDEPTAGMNPAETLELAEQLSALHRMGLAILLIEHKLDVVTRLAGTVFVLDHGAVIAHGLPAEMRRDPAVLEAYLGRGRQAAEAAHVA